MTKTGLRSGVVKGKRKNIIEGENRGMLGKRCVVGLTKKFSLTAPGGGVPFRTSRRDFEIPLQVSDQ